MHPRMINGRDVADPDARRCLACMLRCGPPPSMRQEVPLFAGPGIQITTARFVVGHQTYPIGGITTVAPFSVPAQTGGPIAMIGLGGFFALCGAAGLVDGNAGALFGSMLFGAPLIAGGILWYRSRRATHGVVITTSGMNVRALVTQDIALVHGVVQALNQAIASR